jgi:hypothetical protein
MADKNDPRVLAMVKAWVRFAKSRGIATPEQDGTTPEDTEVLEFVEEYLPAQLNGARISMKLLARISELLQIGSQDRSKQVDPDRLNRVKVLIRDKLTPEQRRQLKRELKRASAQ